MQLVRNAMGKTNGVLSVILFLREVGILFVKQVRLPLPASFRFDRMFPKSVYGALVGLSIVISCAIDAFSAAMSVTSGLPAMRLGTKTLSAKFTCSVDKLLAGLLVVNFGMTVGAHKHKPLWVLFYLVIRHWTSAASAASPVLFIRGILVVKMQGAYALVVPATFALTAKVLNKFSSPVCVSHVFAPSLFDYRMHDYNNSQPETL